MKIKKIIRNLVLTLVLISFSSCATLTGLVTGPFTGAYSLGEETWNLAKSQGETTSKNVGWTTLYGFYGLILGGPHACYKGYFADKGYWERGNYQGTQSYPPFNEVFYPFNFNHTH